MIEEITLRKQIVCVGGDTDGIRLTKNEEKLYCLGRGDVAEIKIKIIKKNDKTIKKQ